MSSTADGAVPGGSGGAGEKNGAEGKPPRAARPPRKLVLLVEDEEHLGEGICLNLEAEGYRVLWARDGEQALDLWREGGVELVVLDVMLPKKSGFEVCERIRAAGDRTPILMLTARTHPDDRIRGLELGADDYLGKPFHLKELLLRIEALFRRQQWAAEPSTSLLRFGQNVVDFTRFEAVGAGGERFTLSQKECQLLRLLAEHSGEVVSRDAILDKVWGETQFPTPRTVDNFIVRLRRRFEPDPASPRYIHTLRGVGYRFTPDA